MYMPFLITMEKPAPSRSAGSGPYSRAMASTENYLSVEKNNEKDLPPPIINY